MKKYYIHFLSLFVFLNSHWTFAQNVGIGTNTPNASAKLDVTSTNSGILIPRVALVNVTNGTSPVSAPATSLLIYNTNAAVTGGNGVGYYYWDGTQWQKLSTAGSSNADITTSTTGVTISNGTDQVIGPTNVTVNVATNSSTSPGLVSSGAGQNTMVWGTDAAGVPTWRSPNSLLTRNNVTSSTTGVTIGNGTNQVVGGANLTVDIATNSSTSPGLVSSGAGQNTMIWGTNAAGAPAWRTALSLLTTRDITTSTTGVTIGNGTAQVIGAANVTVNVATNSSTSPGLVSSGAGQNTKVWGTDAAGNPAWIEATSLVDAQNGLNINTTAPNASAANPYVELGGTLVRNTTITQGAFNMVWDQTGTGNFRINHVNTTAATVGTYPLSISRAGTTDYTMGSDASYVYQQSWNAKPLLINSQGNMVGIGTVAPNASAKLDIVSTNSGLLIPRVALTASNAAGPITTPATSLLVYNTATAGAAPNNVTPGFYYWDGAAWQRFEVGPTAGSNWKLLGNAGTVAATNFIGTTDAIDFVTRTNNTEKMRVTSGGNVGIGTTGPAYQLTLGATGNVFGVENTASFAAKNAGGGYETYLWPRWSDNVMYLNYGSSGFHIRNNSSATTMFMTNGGNVGIGTTGPAYRLDVVGIGGANVDVRSSGRYWSNSTDGGMWLSNLQDGFMGNINANQMGFWSSSVGWSAFNITKSNGYIGIGTTAPGYLLDVNGTIRANDVFGAGGQNIIVGDDSFLTDEDLGNFLGLRSTTNTFANLSVGSTNQGMFSGGTADYFHAGGNQNFGTGGGYLFAASRTANGSTVFETGGFYGDGNSCAIWSPADGNQGQPGAIVYFMDEDFWDASVSPYDNTALKSYINGAGALVTVSDMNKKTDISPINGSLSKLKMIGGYEYRFRLAESEIKKGQTAPLQSGVLAQEIKLAFPTAVEESEAGDMFVNYSALIPYVIEAVKEQQTIIEQQGKLIQEQQQLLLEMKKELEKMKAEK